MSEQFMLPLGLAKGVDLTGLLGVGHKRRLGVCGRKSPSGVQGRSPGREPAGHMLIATNENKQHNNLN